MKIKKDVHAMQQRQDLISELESGFERLVGELASGNLRKARRQARKALAKNHGVWAASLSLIGDEAEEQSFKSALLNLPSVVPGLGTLISFVMMGAADFLILDDCVRLILSLRIVYGLPVEGHEENRERVMRVLSQALELEDPQQAGQALVGQVMPERYVSAFMNRGLTKVLSRLTGRRGLKLLPAGIGVAVSAYGGQRAVRRIGEAALEQILAELKLREAS
jgi:hypothetical protein